jgi:hypothetical protein
MVHSVCYQVQVRVEGQLPPAWESLFAGLEVAPGPEGSTLVGGELADQAALHGVLDAIRDLGLSLVSITAAAEQRPKRTKEG